MQAYGTKADPTEVKEFVEHIVNVNIAAAKRGVRKTSICIWGDKGIGKTDLIKQMAGTIVDRVVDVPIAQIEEMGDFHGLPIHAAREDGTPITVTAPPHWVPTNPEEKSILLIDDFNRADIRIIRGIMQLIQDYKTVSWTLPPLCTIVLTANPGDAEYLVTTLDPAILSRLAHVTMEPDFRVWLAWGEKNGIDERILSFIARYQDMLSPSGAERTCPRSWHMYSDQIKDQTDPKMMKMFGAAFLDEEPVVAFLRFAEGDFGHVIPPEEIVSKYIKDESMSKKLSNMVKDGRIDILNVTMERLVAHVNNMSRVTPGSDTQKNVIVLLEEDFIPNDMKTLYVNLLSKGPMGSQIISAKLATQLRVVV